MGLIRGMLGGLAGGAIGAAIWAAITHFANAEIGWIAWGIGFLVGFGVRMFAGSEEGTGLGILAAAIAVLSILAGKYAAATLIVGKVQQQLGGPAEVSTEMMISTLADEICSEKMEKGEQVAFPPGKSLEDASGPQDYPQAIWQEATTRWTSLSAEERQRQINERQETLRMFNDRMGGALTWVAFKASFGLFDVLWFVLAVSTAFKIGSGAEHTS